MDFELSEEQKLIQQTAREYAQSTLLPRAVDYDRREEFPRQNYTELGELGFMGITVPEEYGGAGGDYLAYGLTTLLLSMIDSYVSAHLYRFERNFQVSLDRHIALSIRF